MLIKRIIAKNFKTYLNLDLDISVEDDKPIILIGGENGGGKTTLFEAIYGALYGLKIANSHDFRELLNSGFNEAQKEKITLELHFSGLVLHEEKQYILQRTYLLNSENKPVESVMFNMSGSVFRYGTATPPKDRADSESQVNKIIKANLPQELSRYFLFDAMESGNLLAKDQLRKVIKENIENVMGFNKYVTLSKTSESVLEEYTAQRIERDNLRKEYLDLTVQKREYESNKSKLRDNLDLALEYSLKNRDFYNDSKSGAANQETLKNKIESTRKEINNTKQREENYRKEIENFGKDIDRHISLPQLVEAFKTEISIILKEKSENETSNKQHLNTEVIDLISENILVFIESKGIEQGKIKSEEIKKFLRSLNENSNSNQYDFLENSEIQSLNNLINSAYSNPFPVLNQQKNELNIAIRNISKLEREITDYERQLAGSFYEIIKTYEDNEQKIKNLELELLETDKNIKKIEQRLSSYDIQNEEEPDPKYEKLKKLKPFFESVANKLLLTKKQMIELKMKNDLNDNLAAYKGVVSRVELSENLKDLSFKIYHTAGNEISLNQLNTASKQIVVQVLLKSLHEFGDYDPPVMIDTVMGVLDEKSRDTILENYFPTLSHQTILLSTDSEVRITGDLKKIEPFISKAYTLVRDKVLQKTEVTIGYFGKNIEN